MKNEISITLMRHGRSQADDEAVHEGRYDSPLTAIGRQQAQTRAAGWLAAGVQFDLVIGSPLARASETAAIVAQALHVPLEQDPLWMERDNGPLAGLAFEEANARYPQPAFRNPYEPLCGVGESEWELQCRGIRAIEKLIRRGAGRYLVVAHGGILNATMRGIVGVSPPVNGQHGLYFAFGDTGYATMLYYADKHQWILALISG